MKFRKSIAYLSCIALAIILAGCHHQVTPAAPVSEAAPPPPPAAPTATLAATPDAIDRGASVALTWNTQNATSITIDGIGAVSASGSQNVMPESSTTYHLTATGAGGTAEASARVTVNIPVAKAPELTDEQLFAQNVKDIFFDFDKYDVRPNETQTAASDAAFLAQHPEINLLIEGHCDDRGSEEYNMGLGEDRASTVRDRLVQLGVGADRIKIVSFGKERPFCSFDDDSCWAQNRRAHFVFEGQNRASADPHTTQ